MPICNIADAELGFTCIFFVMLQYHNQWKSGHGRRKYVLTPVAEIAYDSEEV
jgi:hypothetical protein